MKSFAGKIGIVLIMLLCTSCFDIKEILILKKDGTGTYQFIIDMSQSRAMLSMLENMDNDSTKETSDKKSPFEEVDESFEETRSYLEAITGIINVNSIKDEENLLFGIQFEFLNMYSLNKALNRINHKKEEKIAKEQLYFSLSKKIFKRYNTENFTENLMKSTGMGEGDSLNIAMFFKDLSYSTKYTMPKRIKSMSNPDGILSDDKKTVSVTYYPFRGDEEINFSNKIKF